jgi:hypothetical protein
VIQVQIIDWRGTPIQVGALVVYPGRQSSSMWMVEAEVIEIMEEDKWSYANPRGEKVTALKVQPIRTGRYGGQKKTPVKITAIDRVTVVKLPDTPGEKAYA